EAVVDQALGPLRVEVLEQLTEAALLEVEVLVRPADVVPEDVGSVAVDEVTDMGAAVLPVLVIPRALEVMHVLPAEQRLGGAHMPVEPAGVVDAEAEPGVGGGLRDLADEVPLRAAGHGVAVPGAGCIPQGHAVVVLGGGDDVVRAGATEEIRPLRGIELRGVPLVEEVVVRRTAVDLLVVLRRWGAFDAD